MKRLYPIVVNRANDGVLVYVPDLDIHTEGVDLYDAFIMARDAISLCIIDMEDDGKEVPLPTSVKYKMTSEEKKTTSIHLIDVDTKKYREFLYEHMFTEEKAEGLFKELVCKKKPFKSKKAIKKWIRKKAGCELPELEVSDYDPKKPGTIHCSFGSNICSRKNAEFILDYIVLVDKKHYPTGKIRIIEVKWKE